MRCNVLSVGIDNHTLGSATDAAVALLEGGGTHTIVTPNAEMLLAARRNGALRACLREASLVLADGVGVVRAAKILGRPLQGRVPGIELAEALLPYLANGGKSLFLFGGRPGVAVEAAGKLRERYPTLTIYTAHGYHSDGNAAVARSVADVQADVVYVCLGSPAQELWMRDFGGATGAKLLIGLGGTVDGFAGRVKRAPVWMRNAGLEWLYRLVRDPKRVCRIARLPLVLVYARKQKKEERRRGI